MSKSTMPLQERIDADLKQAMRDNNATAKMTLRAVKTSLTEAMKAGSDHTLSPEQVLAVVQREAKRRREAADEYARYGAEMQALQERAELAILERYLPQQMSEAEIEAVARETLAETGITSAKEMGRAMNAVMARLAGKADGKVVSQVVRRLLAN